MIFQEAISFAEAINGRNDDRVAFAELRHRALELGPVSRRAGKGVAIDVLATGGLQLPLLDSKVLTVRRYTLIAKKHVAVCTRVMDQKS